MFEKYLSRYTLSLKLKRINNMKKYYLGLGGQLADEDLKRVGQLHLRGKNPEIIRELIICW